MSYVNDRQGKLCWAGRWAFNEGRWDAIAPCMGVARNALGIGGPEGTSAQFPGVMYFCDEHMEQLIDQGLIEEPFMEPDEFDRRRQKRSTP